jgi:hypothetical protein
MKNGNQQSKINRASDRTIEKLEKNNNIKFYHLIVGKWGSDFVASRAP